MVRSLTHSILLVLSLCFLLPADTLADESQAAVSARMLMQVIDTVVENHIEPPTRQQLVLDAIRYAARRNNQTVSAELSRQISFAEPESLEVILAQELSKYIKGDDASKRLPDLPSSIVEYLMSQNIRVSLGSDHRIQESIAGNRYVGIGVSVTMFKQTDQLQIVKVVSGGAADRAGARDGDIVETVNGKSTAGVSLADTIKWLRGEAGSEVTVTLRQPNQKDAREYTMTRGIVHFETVNPPDYSDDNRVVAIGFKHLSGSTVHELRKIEAALPDSVEVVTLDFRNQAGTNLQHGILLANALLDGKPIGKVESTTGIRQVTAEPGTLFGDRKLLIVINQGTGGTPLWIANAVKDNSEEQIVFGQSGTSSFVQEAVPLAGTDYVIDMPTQRLLRSNGKSLQFFDPYGIRVSSRNVRFPAATPAQQRDTPGFVSPNPAHTDHFDQIPFNKLANAVSRKLIQPPASDEPKE